MKLKVINSNVLYRKLWFNFLHKKLNPNFCTKHSRIVQLVYWSLKFSTFWLWPLHLINNLNEWNYCKYIPAIYGVMVAIKLYILWLRWLVTNSLPFLWFPIIYLPTSPVFSYILYFNFGFPCPIHFFIFFLSIAMNVTLDETVDKVK